MKPLPECNGRPQLWSCANFKTIQIVYPDGKVEWACALGEFVVDLNTLRSQSQKESVMRLHNYEYHYFVALPEFLGYL